MNVWTWPSPEIPDEPEKLRPAAVLTPKDKADLAALVTQIDEEYFALQEAAQEGRANTEDYMLVFGQARAVAALTFAGGEDTLQAAAEAIYEAGSNNR
jgi:hypothetical protein